LSDLADRFWEALKEQCAATKDKSKVKMIVMVSKADVVAAVKRMEVKKDDPDLASCRVERSRHS